MNDRNSDIKNKILEVALGDVPFDGWTWDVLTNAAEKAGYGADMATAVFPDKVMDALRHFSEWADSEMLAALNGVDIEELRVRDRVRLAVQKRLEILEAHKEAVRAASVYWLVPTRKIEAGKQVWKTADVIWNWAGDSATDYNHYTKRGLLSGVITSTTMAWLNDTSENHQETLAFLDRRIDNALRVGKVGGKILKPLLGFLGTLKSKRKSDHA